MNVADTSDPADVEGPLPAGLVAMFAHDMRNHLGGIFGGLALIDRSGLTPETCRQLDNIADSATAIAGLLDSTIVSAATGESRVAFAPLDVAGFLRGLARLWSSDTETKGLRLITSFEVTAPEQVHTDSGRLRRVLGNLLANAVKYTGGGSITLRARLDGEGNPVFEVEDTGPGLSEQARRLLFVPFARPAGSGRGGSGLGLYIARALTHELGGNIAILDAPGGGCLARVTLPAEGGERSRPDGDERGAAQRAGSGADAAPGSTGAMAAPAPQSPTPSAPALPDLGALHVLMAEDNVTNQLVAGQMLQSMKARVTLAADGAEALEALERERFDLLLVDIEMPRVSGLDVIRRVRAMQDARSAMPIVALTAYAMREHREKIGAAGADGVIAKPILGIREFGEQILAHIAARRARSAPPAVAADEVQADTAAADAEGGKPVDPAIFDALAAAIGREGMGELLTKVEEDLVAVGDGIRKGLATGDAAIVRARTHVLISVAGAVGAIGVQREAEALNRAAHRGDPAGIAAAGAHIATGLARLISYIAERRKTV